jgi:predicted Zn-dependent peptidase
MPRSLRQVAPFLLLRPPQVPKRQLKIGVSVKLLRIPTVLIAAFAIVAAVGTGAFAQAKPAAQHFIPDVINQGLSIVMFG